MFSNQLEENIIPLKIQMDRTLWKTVFIIGVITLTSGRFVGPFHGDKETAKSLWRNDESTDGINFLRKFQPSDVSHRQNRLSEAEFSTYSLQEPNGPGTYAFGYDNVADPTGNEHFRSEERLQNGTVMGEYGYTDYKNNKLVRVTYIADLGGYRRLYDDDEDVVDMKCVGRTCTRIAKGSWIEFPEDAADYALVSCVFSIIDNSLFESKDGSATLG